MEGTSGVDFRCRIPLHLQRPHAPTFIPILRAAVAEGRDFNGFYFPPDVLEAAVRRWDAQEAPVPGGSATEDLAAGGLG